MSVNLCLSDARKAVPKMGIAQQSRAIEPLFQATVDLHLFSYFLWSVESNATVALFPKTIMESLKVFQRDIFALQLYRRVNDDV